MLREEIEQVKKIVRAIVKEELALAVDKKSEPELKSEKPKLVKDEK